MRLRNDRHGNNVTTLHGVRALAPNLHNGSLPALPQRLTPDMLPDGFVCGRLDDDTGIKDGGKTCKLDGSHDAEGASFLRRHQGTMSRR